MVQDVCMRLKGERGASLSFALLLMLVCTMVTAVVLAASTASFGQFANRAAMDQRYYSVTSAGDALRKLVLKKQMTVKVTATKDALTNGVPPDLAFEYEPGMSGNKTLEALTGLLFEPGGPVDSWLLFEQGGPVDSFMNPGAGSWPHRFSLTVTPSAGSSGGLYNKPDVDVNVTVEGSMDDSGVLKLDIHNIGADAANTYHLGMSFTPDMQEVWDETDSEGERKSEYIVSWGLLELNPGRDVVE